jgi:hypothetical protein
MVRRSELPCVRQSRTLYRERFVRNVVSVSLEKKSDQEAKKSQGIGLTQNRILVAKISGV